MTTAFILAAPSRSTVRNAGALGCNKHGEVVFSRRGAENAEDVYAYDGIGNLQIASFNFVTNTYTANNLNQYTSILRALGAGCFQEFCN